MRRVRPWSGYKGNGGKTLLMILILTTLLSSSIIIRSVATNGSTSISANCDECHAPSIYLIVEIRFIDAPSMIVRNESTLINVSVEVSGSHKSYIWSGFGIDVWLLPGTDHTSCGPHQILNGQKPYGPSSPYTWTKTFSFSINSSLVGNETITVNARMSPIHESPPVTARNQITIPVVENRNVTFPLQEDPNSDNEMITGTDDDRRSKLGPIGLSILIIGGLAVFAGLVYTVYSLMAPVKEIEGKRYNAGGHKS